VVTSIREFDDPSDDPATRPAIRPGPAVLRRREVAWLGGVACVGVILCWAVSRNAFNVPVDGQAYLGAAHNLAAGKGLTTPFAVFTSRLSPDRQLAFHGAIPLTHFPPAFPVLLAAVSKFGMAT
jgi:hypothetical protein